MALPCRAPGDNANALTVQTNGQIPRSGNAGDATVLNADPLSTTGVHSSGHLRPRAWHPTRSLIRGLTGGFVLAQTSANITTLSTDPNAQSYGIFAHSFAIYSAPASVAEIEDDGARIQTFGGGSATIFASSEGGYGANGSSGLSGSSGSPAARVDPVEILGSGTLLTSGNNSQGILAVSRGGIGGSGGDGYLANAGNGVFGGAAGDVSVTGNWTISTLGAARTGFAPRAWAGKAARGARDTPSATAVVAAEQRLCGGCERQRHRPNRDIRGYGQRHHRPKRRRLCRQRRQQLRLDCLWRLG
ncbi:MAG: hypothetical protein WDM77_21940 [Steroidobacteraceae bacterium]